MFVNKIRQVFFLSAFCCSSLAFASSTKTSPTRYDLICHSQNRLNDKVLNITIYPVTKSSMWSPQTYSWKIIEEGRIIAQNWDVTIVIKNNLTFKIKEFEGNSLVIAGASLESKTKESFNGLFNDYDNGPTRMRCQWL